MHLIIKMGKAILRAVYTVFKLLPVQNRILFISRQSDEPGLDIKMLTAKINERNPYFDVVVLCKAYRFFVHISHVQANVLHSDFQSADS